MIQGLMTFFALVTYEIRFDSLICGGCDHVTRLSSADFEANEGLYTNVGEMAGTVVDDMLECMWSSFGTEVAHKLRAPRG